MTGHTSLTLAAAVLSLLMAANVSAAGAGESASSDGVTSEKHSPADVPKLVRSLGGSDFAAANQARSAIVELLKGKQHELTLAYLNAETRKANEKVKAQVAACLTLAGRAESAELVIYLFEQRDPEVKLAALSAIGRLKLHSDDVLEDVRDLLDSDDNRLRKEAVLAVGRAKDKLATETLLELISTEDAGLRGNVQWALEQITGKKLGDKPERWHAWQEAQERLEDIEDEREAKKTKGMRAVVKKESKPEEEPVDRTKLHLALSFSGLALLALLAAGVWVVMPTWLNARIGQAEDRRARGDGANVAYLAKRFRASDHMPDFVVYPFLLSTLTNGSPAQKEIALRLLELRAFGGCRLLTDKRGLRGRGKPTSVSSQWVSTLPRSLLEDLATLRGPGRRLVLVLDPDNPRWKRAATRDETRKAQRSYNSWLGKSA